MEMGYLAKKITIICFIVIVTCGVALASTTSYLCVKQQDGLLLCKKTNVRYSGHTEKYSYCTTEVLSIFVTRETCTEVGVIAKLPEDVYILEGEAL